MSRDPQEKSPPGCGWQHAGACRGEPVHVSWTQTQGVHTRGPSPTSGLRGGSGQRESCGDRSPVSSAPGWAGGHLAPLTAEQQGQERQELLASAAGQAVRKRLACVCSRPCSFGCVFQKKTVSLRARQLWNGKLACDPVHTVSSGKCWDTAFEQRGEEARVVLSPGGRGWHLRAGAAEHPAEWGAAPAAQDGPAPSCRWTTGRHWGVWLQVPGGRQVRDSYACGSRVYSCRLVSL